MQEEPDLTLTQDAQILGNSGLIVVHKQPSGRQQGMRHVLLPLKAAASGIGSARTLPRSAHLADWEQCVIHICHSAPTGDVHLHHMQPENILKAHA